MIFERMLGNNIFRKVKQLETLSRNNTLFANSCKPLQFGRTSTSLASINRCLNSNIINNGKTYSLAKLTPANGITMQLNRQASTSTGDHVRLWVLERVAATILPFIIPAAIIMENAMLDGVMSALVVMHTHWGLEAIITDYARPRVVGQILPKILHLSLFLLSAVTLAGLFKLIYDGPGVSRAIKDFWAIGKEKNSAASSE